MREALLAGQSECRIHQYLEMPFPDQILPFSSASAPQGSADRGTNRAGFDARRTRRVLYGLLGEYQMLCVNRHTESEIVKAMTCDPECERRHAAIFIPFDARFVRQR